uniref:PHD-type domain-containing protein n=1 Tax=Strigamia maritima TaxID=126957 RepID=T1IR34_STRMM
MNKKSTSDLPTPLPTVDSRPDILDWTLSKAEDFVVHTVKKPTNNDGEYDKKQHRDPFDRRPKVPFYFYFSSRCSRLENVRRGFTFSAIQQFERFDMIGCGHCLLALLCSRDYVVWTRNNSLKYVKNQENDFQFPAFTKNKIPYQKPKKIQKEICEKKSCNKVNIYLDYNSKIQPTITMICKICGHINFNTPEVISCKICRNTYHAECINKTMCFQSLKESFTCETCDSIWQLLPETSNLSANTQKFINRKLFKKIWFGPDANDTFRALDSENNGEITDRVYLIAATLIKLKNINKLNWLEVLTPQEIVSLKKSFTELDLGHKGFISVENARKSVVKWMQSRGVDIKLCELYSYKMVFNNQERVSWIEFLLENVLNILALRPNVRNCENNFLWLVN